MRRFFSFFILCSVALVFSGCFANQPAKTSLVDVPQQSMESEHKDVKKEDGAMQLLIGETVVPVKWEDNPSVADLRKHLPLTIQMSRYGGNEQVGAIGQDIVRDDKETTTHYGDIVLYSGNKIVIFYGSNTWAYTRLGHVELSQQEMTGLLSSKDIKITISER